MSDPIKSRYAGWDKSGPRYLATAAKATQQVRIALTLMYTAAADVATRAGLPELLPADEVKEMAEMAEDVIKNLRRFQRRIRTGVTDTGVTPRCERCGEPFAPTRSDARYCSTACRVAAHRDRKAG